MQGEREGEKTEWERYGDEEWRERERGRERGER